MPTTQPQTALDRFARSLAVSDPLAALRGGLIGDGVPVPGPFGDHPLLYADYVASGRALRQVETFVMEEVLPYYANSHTEASFCGSAMTRMRRGARAIIAQHTGATSDHAVIFAGAGATAGLNRLVHLLGIPAAVQRGERPVVFIGPYEHHSNILPWRESGAEVIEIDEAGSGGPDLEHLADALRATADRGLRIGAFSAASNVTGIITDTDAVTRLLRSHNVLSVWDYAGGGPYLPIDMRGGTDCAKDAVVLSAHKFLGGPGASGVLILRRAAVDRVTPVLPGGGTVRFVSPTSHDYATDIIPREESGTPNVIGDIRVALAFLVKAAIGQATMDARHDQLNTRALAVWQRNPQLQILGLDRGARLPVFSFRVRDPQGNGYIHQQLFTRMLSDCYGIQARGGCACAGPYAHRLLGIGSDLSDTLRRSILSGNEGDKPGWTRLNFSVLLDDTKADRLIQAVDELARNPCQKAALYDVDQASARYSARPDASAA
ncbi:MAG: aminotransferase class V-fold PLP-dependent enzyme [Gemmobacter sp.]|nr:aminotransferase class V-fold PLP-dependent enzyme [Gemmobacter sp.]